MQHQSIEKLLKTNIAGRIVTQLPNSDGPLSSRWCVWQVADASGKNLWRVRYLATEDNLDTVFCESLTAKTDLEWTNARVITGKLKTVKNTLERLPAY